MNIIIYFNKKKVNFILDVNMKMIFNNYNFVELIFSKKTWQKY